MMNTNSNYSNTSFFSFLSLFSDPSKYYLMIFYGLFVLTNILLFLWQRHLYPYINTDGVTYMQAAGAYLSGGYKAAVHIGYQAQMPFLSILIATVARSFDLGLLTGAYLLNGFFVCLSGLVFLTILRQINSQTIMLWLGAITWLVWHQYTHWWSQIMRDHGSMVCYLLSIYCLIKFYISVQPRTNDLTNSTTVVKKMTTYFWALAWSLVLLLGSLFRFELAIFLVVIPIMMIASAFKGYRKKLLIWLQLNSTVLVLLFVIVLLFSMGNLSIDKLHGLRLAYIVDAFTNYFTITHQTYLTHRADFVTTLSSSWLHYVDPIFILKLIYGGCKAVVKIIGPVGWLAVVVWCYFKFSGSYKASDTDQNRASSRILLSYFIVALLIPTAFYIQNLFLNSRYVLPLGLVILLTVIPALAELVKRYLRNAKKYRLVVVLLVLIMLYSLIASLYRFGHVSNYDHVAAAWIKANYPNKSLFTNSKIVLFEVSEPPNYDNGQLAVISADQFLISLESGQFGELGEKSWRKYDLLVLVGNVEQLQLIHHYLARQNQVGPVLKIFHAEHDAREVLITAIK